MPGNSCLPLASSPRSRPSLCMTARLWEGKPEEFRGLREAYLRHDELGLEYATAGNGEHSRIAWLKLTSLWSGHEKAYVRPERVEAARGTLPDGADHIGVNRGPLVLPPQAVVAVFARLDASWAATVVVARESGPPWERQVVLPRRSYVPWWHYPALPATVAFDAVTLHGMLRKAPGVVQGVGVGGQGSVTSLASPEKANELLAKLGQKWDKPGPPVLMFDNLG